jgi:hypothetical protein
MLNMAAQAAYADPRDSAPEATAPVHSELSGPAVDDEGLQLVPGTPLRATATALPIDSLAAALCPELDPPQLTMLAMPAEDVVWLHVWQMSALFPKSLSHMHVC